MGVVREFEINASFTSSARAPWGGARAPLENIQLFFPCVAGSISGYRTGTLSFSSDFLSVFHPGSPSKKYIMKSRFCPFPMKLPTLNFLILCSNTNYICMLYLCICREWAPYRLITKYICTNLSIEGIIALLNVESKVKCAVADLPIIYLGFLWVWSWPSWRGNFQLEKEIN